MGKERHGQVRMYVVGISPSDLWRNSPGRNAYQNTTRDDMQAEIMELRSQVQNLKSLLERAPSKLSNSSRQVNSLQS